MRASEIAVVVLTLVGLVLCLSLVRAYNQHRTQEGPVGHLNTDHVAWMTALGVTAVAVLTISAIAVIASTWR